MNTRKATGVLLASLVSFGCVVPFAQAKEAAQAKKETNSPPQTANDGGKFVQQFYDWYNAKPEKTLETALAKKPQSFDPHLIKLLKADIEASSKVPDEIVGLDFDPITSTNAENADKYVVGKVVPKGKTQWVDVYGFDGKKKSDKPIITPEVEFKDNHWVFVNFHYGKSEFPENENLLSVLKTLADSRKENPAVTKKH